MGNLTIKYMNEPTEFQFFLQEIQNALMNDEKLIKESGDYGDYYTIKKGSFPFRKNQLTVISFFCNKADVQTYTSRGLEIIKNVSKVTPSDIVVEDYSQSCKEKANKDA